MEDTALAVELKGYLNTGFWYVTNNTEDSQNFVVQDDYGQSYVQGNFSMFTANTDFRLLQLNKPGATLQLSAQLKSRHLYNILDKPYAFAPPDRYRHQYDEMNVLMEHPMVDLWLGRHTVFETGGVGVDGVTSLFHLKKDEIRVGAYGGLGNDPRTLTGYIGPTYKTAPFTADFQTGGTFAKLHYENLRLDVGTGFLFFKGAVDRANAFTQFYWKATPSFGFSGYLDAGYLGDTGLQKSLLMVTTEISEKLTNRLTFSQFRSVYYRESNASAIPVPAGINPSFNIGTDVDTSDYYIARDEIQYRFARNYIFVGGEFGRRTFDDQNRIRYYFGYFDPALFQSEYDLRFQTDIIDNYISYNTMIDILVGRDFANDQFRAELGGTFYANERDLYAGGVFVTSDGEVEKEAAARANLIWNVGRHLTWFLNYAFYRETDVVNLKDYVATHEIFLMSNIRF